MIRAANKLVIITIALLISACSSLQPTQAPYSIGYTETGKATFYAEKHQSKKTANGELYNRNLLTAAHRKLPFGTRIKVTNTANGKSVIARVNDRGPYVKNCIVDLSKSAFASIANTALGVIAVELEVIE